MKNFRYAAAQAMKQIKRNKGMSAASVFAITAMMLILGLFFVIIVNVGQAAEGIRDDYNTIEVYYLDKTPKAKIMKELSAVEKWKNVDSVKYRSKNDAMKIMKKRWGDNAYMLDSLGENPLPRSLVIKVKNIEKSDAVADKARKLKGIEDISYYKDTVDKLVRFTNGMQLAGALIIVFLIIVSLLVVANTIKLTVLNRSEEIQIMKYIGATNWFIRGPFMLEGMIIGAVSALVAALITALIYGRVVSAIGGGMEQLLSVPMIPAFDLTAVLFGIFLVLGIGIGALGSAISMRRFLNV